MTTMRALTVALALLAVAGCGTAEDVPYCAEDGRAAEGILMIDALPCLDPSLNSAGPCVVVVQPETGLQYRAPLAATGCQSARAGKYAYVCTGDATTAAECPFQPSAFPQ